MKKASGKSNINIIKDYLAGERPFVQVGYVPPVEGKHKDGDVWVDKNGIEWIQKGACKFSKKVYDTREATRQICPDCQKDIYWSSNHNDQKMFNKTGKCFDCLIIEETKMRLDGTWNTYEKIKVIKNQRSFLKEFKVKIEESIEWLNNKSNKIEYVNEDGSIEYWNDLSKETFLIDAEKDLAEINKSIILCNESIAMLESELNELKSKSTVS